MSIFMLLTLAALALIQSLDGRPDQTHPVLRASLIWGGIVVLSTELLSLLKAVDALNLSLVWGGCLLLSLGWLVWQLRRGKRLPRLAWPSFESPADAVLFTLTVLLVAGTLFVALKAPVQTYDSLSYHMSRVAHWAQDRSVAIYATGIERQNMMGPMAEYVILHFYVLQQGDLLANLVDWLAYLGCIFAAAQVAARMGAGRRGQLLAAVFTASLPMAIAQASSSMTDIVVAFWTMCGIAEITAALAARQAAWRNWLYLAAAAGLAVLTKSTAIAFVMPFLLWFGIWALATQGFRRTALRLLPFLAIFVAINSFFWVRNTQVFGTPFGSDALVALHANKIITPAVLVSNTIRNIGLNFDTPSSQVNHFILAVISKLHSLVGMNFKDPRTTYNGVYSITDQVLMEDRTGNPLHLLFIGIAAGIALFARKRTGPMRWYALAAMATFLLFSIGNTVQVFGNRLLIPFFMLSAPLVGWIIARWRPWVSLPAGYLLLLAGLPWLLSLQSRPILPIPGQTIAHSILDMSRLDLYFTNVGSLSSAQTRTVNHIQSAGCSDVGLMLGGDDPEYLWWVLLGEPRSQLRLEWLVKGTPSDQFADPDFKPCAVICTSCPADWKTAFGLPLDFQSGNLRLFLGTAH
jgi:hypothetical protein